MPDDEHAFHVDRDGVTVRLELVLTASRGAEIHWNAYMSADDARELADRLRDVADEVRPDLTKKAIAAAKKRRGA